MKDKSGLFLSVIPVFAGAGLAWLCFGIIKNETSLLKRKVELEQALSAKSDKARRTLLLRKKDG